MNTSLPTQNKKKTIIIATVLSISVIGLVIGLILVGQRQLFRQEAAVTVEEGGIATASIIPGTKTIEVDETFTADIFFDSADRPISGITVRLGYSFTGDEPPISASSNIQISSTLTSDPLWEFPSSQNSVETIGNNVQIRITGLNNSVDGYTSVGDVKLATLTFTGESPGLITVSFDAVQSIIGDKNTADDILLIPESTGIYTVMGSEIEEDEEEVACKICSGVTCIENDELNCSTSLNECVTDVDCGGNGDNGDSDDNGDSNGSGGSGGSGETATPAPTPTLAPTSTSTPFPVPESGVSAPTIIGVGVGVILMIGSLFLAL